MIALLPEMPFTVYAKLPWSSSLNVSVALPTGMPGSRWTLPSANLPTRILGPCRSAMDRARFQRVLDDARTLDATLSADPADYLVDNFHFNNEVGGEGEIGLTLHAYRLRLLRR